VDVKNPLGGSGGGGGLLALPGMQGRGAAGGGVGAGFSGFFPLTRATTPSFPDPPVLGAEEDDDLSISLARSPSLTRNPSISSPNPNKPSSSLAAAMGGGKTAGSANLDFSKDPDAVPPLPSRIHRVFYLNQYGMEIWPRPNGIMLEALQKATWCVFQLPHLALFRRFPHDEKRLEKTKLPDALLSRSFIQPHLRPRLTLHLHPPLPRASSGRASHLLPFSGSLLLPSSSLLSPAGIQNPPPQHPSRPRDPLLHLRRFHRCHCGGL
jgi:hypothetical protein